MFKHAFSIPLLFLLLWWREHTYLVVMLTRGYTLCCSVCCGACRLSPSFSCGTFTTLRLMIQGSLTAELLGTNSRGARITLSARGGNGVQTHSWPRTLSFKHCLGLGGMSRRACLHPQHGPLNTELRVADNNSTRCSPQNKTATTATKCCWIGNHHLWISISVRVCVFSPC